MFFFGKNSLRMIAAQNVLSALLFSHFIDKMTKCADKNQLKKSLMILTLLKKQSALKTSHIY